MLKGTKYSRNLLQMTLIMSFQHFEEMISKMSLFVIYEILGLFFNTLTANDKYSLA